MDAVIGLAIVTVFIGGTIAFWTWLYRFDRRIAQRYGACGPNERVKWWWPEINNPVTAEFVTKRIGYWLAFQVAVMAIIGLVQAPADVNFVVYAIMVAILTIVMASIPAFLLRMSRTAAVVMFVLQVCNLFYIFYTLSSVGPAQGQGSLGDVFGVVQGINAIRATYFYRAANGIVFSARSIDAVPQ